MDVKPVSWLYDLLGEPFVFIFDRYLINGNQTLKITNTQTNRDRGMYKCQAINSNAEKALENTVKLTVYGKLSQNIVQIYIVFSLKIA